MDSKDKIQQCVLNRKPISQTLLPLGWSGEFWEVLGRCFVQCLWIWIRLIFFFFLMIRLGFWVSGRTIKEVKWNCHHSWSRVRTVYQHDSSRLRPALFTGLTVLIPVDSRGLCCAVPPVSQAVLPEPFPLTLSLLVQSFFQKPVQSLRILRDFCHLQPAPWVCDPCRHTELLS